MSAMPKAPAVPDSIKRQRVRKLINRLKSGKDRQVTGEMYSLDGSFCVMGLATEIFREDTQQGEWIPDDGFKLGDNYHLDNAIPPQEVADFFGFHDTEGGHNLEQDDPDAMRRTLMGMNDDEGYSFEEFAEYLEKHYDVVFDHDPGVDVDNPPAEEDEE